MKTNDPGNPKYQLGTWMKVSDSATPKMATPGERLWLYASHLETEETSTNLTRRLGQIYLAEAEEGYTVWVHEDDLEPVA